MEHFSNREEPHAFEMTKVVKRVSRLLNAHNNRGYELELLPACFFLQTPQGAFMRRPKIKGFFA